MSKAVEYLKKIPDDFTQVDIDDYLTMLFDHPRHYSQSYFKHTVFGLKDYYKYLDLEEPKGLILPKIRKTRTLPRVLSFAEVCRLISLCALYEKTLFSIIYDCGLRANEVCNLKWHHINFDRQMLLIELGKGRKDRYVQISGQLIKLLVCYRKRYPSDSYVFRSRGNNPQPIKPAYVRTIFKSALNAACLDHTITVHALRHSYASHLLEKGESILDVKKRLGHTNIRTTMAYLHIIDVDPQKHVRLIDEMFPPKDTTNS